MLIRIQENILKLEIHKRIIDVYDPSSKTIDSLMKLDLPSGIDIDVRL